MREPARDSARANELININKGKLRPVLTKIYPFSEVHLAHQDMQTGQKLGNVVCLVWTPKAGLRTYSDLAAIAG